MKALIIDKKGTIGAFLVDFKPIANDWLSWQTHDRKIKLIHERCYHRLAIEHSDVSYLNSPGVCCFCGVEAPELVQQFVLLAGAVRGYNEGKTEK